MLDGSCLPVKDENLTQMELFFHQKGLEEVLEEYYVIVQVIFSLHLAKESSNHSQPSYVKLLAIKEGLQFPQSLQIENVDVETNHLEPAMDINQPEYNVGVLNNLIEDIAGMLQVLR